MSKPKPMKLNAKLPQEPVLNGLDTVYEQLASFGTARIIMEVSCAEVALTIGGGRKPVLTIEHVEGLPKGDLDKAGERLIRQARADRETASGTLPGMGTDDLKPEPIRHPRADDPEY